MTTPRPLAIAADADRDRALDATLDLSVVLSSAGTDLLAAGGGLGALFNRDLVPGVGEDRTILRRAREAVERAAKALADYDTARGPA